MQAQLPNLIFQIQQTNLTISATKKFHLNNKWISLDL